MRHEVMVRHLIGVVTLKCSDRHNISHYSINNFISTETILFYNLHELSDYHA